MLQAIEDEIMISPDGRLPEVFRPMFGHKARVIVLLTEPETTAIEQDQSEQLMAFAGTIDWPVSDPREQKLMRQRGRHRRG